MENPETSFGELLKSYRLEAGFTQAELGLRSGMDGAAVRRLERPSAARPQLLTILRLAAGLGLCLHDKKTYALLTVAGYIDEAEQVGEDLLNANASFDDALQAQVNWAIMLFELSMSELFIFANNNQRELSPQLVDYLELLSKMSKSQSVLLDLIWLKTFPEEERQKRKRQRDY